VTTGTGAKQVFLKELREFARDRRVLQASVVMPIFMVALFVFIFGIIQTSVSEKPKVEIAIVSTAGIDYNSFLPEESQDSITPVSSWEEGSKLVRDKHAQLIIEVKQGADTTYRVGYLESAPLSAMAVAALQNQLTAQNLTLVKETLKANNLPDQTEHNKLQRENLDKDDGLAGSIIVSLLPYLIVLWAFQGGMSVVADLVAGEKERGTMETLLVSPVRRAAVALGKILAVMVVCFVGSLTTLAGVFLAATIKNPLTKNLFPTGVSIGFVDIIFTVITILTLVAFFATLMVTIAARARNIREAQTHLGLLTFMILMPAVFSQIIGFTGLESATWVYWTPVLNAAVVIKNLILGSATMGQLTPVWIVNLILAAIFLRTSIQLFRREEILLRV
jgi:sodium transport system permease protein